MDSGAVNRVGQQTNGEAVRDPLRINSGEGAEMNAMSGGNGHMMSPGQEHMRHGGHGGQEGQGDMRQESR